MMRAVQVPVDEDGVAEVLRHDHRRLKGRDLKEGPMGDLVVVASIELDRTSRWIREEEKDVVAFVPHSKRGEKLSLGLEVV